MDNIRFIVDDKYMKLQSVEIAIKLLEHYLNASDKFITYGELCNKLSFPISPRNVDIYLGDISFACKDNGLPPLSALVINKEGRCGAGFFKAYCPEVAEEDWTKKWVEICNDIIAYKNWDKVLEVYKSLE